MTSLNNGGGATLLSRQDKGFGGLRWKKILRYYGTKALRGNRNVGRHYYADRKVYRRVSKPDLQDIKRIDTTPETNYNSNMMNYKSETLKRVQHDRSGSEAHSKHLVPYCLSNLVSSKKVAFTLAEILITLGIIGIVAAMTIPTLISNYNKKQTVTRLKQTYSILSQALSMAQAEHGDPTTWDLSGIRGADSLDPDFPKEELITAFSQKYLIPYVKVTRNFGYNDSRLIGYGERTAPTTGLKYVNSGYMFLLSNNVYVNVSFSGRCIEYDGDTCIKRSVNNIVFLTDMNGFSQPNTVGKDLFYMQFDVETKKFSMMGNARNKAIALQNCKNDAQFCGFYIFLNDWQIDDSYPWL